MKLKQIGIFLIVTSIVLAVFFGYFRYHLIQSYQSEIVSTEGGVCEHTGNLCPYEKINYLLIPTMMVGAILLIMILIGIYLIFFEKSEERWEKTRETLSTRIGDIKRKEVEKEKAEAFLSALNSDEKKVYLAIKEQDGIEQSTLRYRADLSKTKLSFVLKDLEEKNIIKKVPYKRTNKVYLKKNYIRIL